MADVKRPTRPSDQPRIAWVSRPLRAAALSLALLASACGQEPRKQDNASFDAAIPPTAANAVNAADNAVGNEGAGEAGAPVRVTAPDAIPAAFHGRWTGLQVACDDARSDLRLAVTAKEMRYYESLGTVIAVEAAGPHAVIVDARYEGEGHVWQRRQKLTLSPDRDRLIVANQGNAITRKRCSAAL